ncbi:MAG: enoyl-CoA hydratase-related protein [Candidatus Thermoplasmatota archaeon]|nr:enoyl-CoA hydratase-related protein [Candidatus Thermoplasmatota archaeon]
MRLDEEEGIAIVTLDRPEALNALNTEMLHELREVLQEVARRKDLQVVILTGAGDRAFAAGADIREMEDQRPLETEKYAALGHEVACLLERMGKPVIAALNGLALGGGAELALACDIRLASERAQIGQPEVKLGIPPGFGGSQRLTRLVGRGRASELIFLGEPIGAADAERIGLVNRVVAPERLLDEAKRWARQMQERGPLALMLAKAAIHQTQETGLSAGLDYELKLFSLAFGTDDREEGLRAFLEQRKPEFKGS